MLNYLNIFFIKCYVFVSVDVWAEWLRESWIHRLWQRDQNSRHAWKIPGKFLLPFCCWAYICPVHKKVNKLWNHCNTLMVVFIGKLSLSTIRWVPICQGFSHFSAFFHHFMLAKLATSSDRVKYVWKLSCWAIVMRVNCTILTGQYNCLLFNWFDCTL